tara:strand:+ start:38 stop:286 length:249 start_codon:yes stop_codon:yes gene_type:complete
MSNITNKIRMEALKEASISIACCLDEVGEVTQSDLEHIQMQLCILENYEDELKIRKRNCLRIMRFLHNKQKAIILRYYKQKP